ncbi:MAG: AAA family ATPase [Candidatus Cryptobacteroides sp.]
MLYPIGIQNFESLREGGYIYVDKTASIYNLATYGKYYFLSRPRRFGKSLLISTMEAYFRGRKELFKGLAIENMEKDWEEYPVLHLDLGGKAYDSPGSVEDNLDYHLVQWEKKYGGFAGKDIDTRFKAVIDNAYEQTGKKVVILVDEYDKPIVDNLGDAELVERYMKTLQGFYGVLKAKDGKIRFGFLTGVSKIGKLSVFSALNNLKDISLTNEFSAICGISEDELRKYFDDSVVEVAESNSLTKEECYHKLKKTYDGYHFAGKAVGVYNPFSLLNAFTDRDFREYWFETGTPSLLVNVMKQTSFDITSLTDNVIVGIDDLSGMQDITGRPIPLFFQTGYLTIKDYDREYQEYRLGFPNNEVKTGFLRFIYSNYVPINPAEGNTTASRLARALRAGRPEDFLGILQTIFSGATYEIEINSEKSFQQAIYVITELVGEFVEAERHTSNGRIDLLLQTKDYIYIIELKIDKSADEALKQIEEKDYGGPFASDSRKLFKIGINFSTKERRIDDWKIA